MTKTPTFLVNSEVEGLRKERARHPDSQAADVAFRADSSTLSRALWEQERELFSVKQFLGSPSRTGWVVGHSVEAEHRTPVCCHKSMGRDLSAGRCWMGSVEGPCLTRVNSTRPDKGSSEAVLPSLSLDHLSLLLLLLTCARCY